jgi:hypothetical protein
MDITRKQFCGALAGGTVVLLLDACGGGGYSAPAGVVAMSCGASGTAIAGNHGHLLVIATADLDSMVDKTYSLTGAPHDHQITFTAAQLLTLKMGGSVTVVSGPASAPAMDAHTHSVMASCA